MTPDLAPIGLLIGSIFTSNILLANFLGMCSFISISRDLNSASGLGMAVTLVLLVTGVINWLILHFVLIPLGLVYLEYIIFIIVIASVVQVLEMIVDRVSPPLYLALGIFLPLITVNCAILGVALFIDIRHYSLLQTALYSFGSGLGWWLAITLLAAMRKKTDKSPVPEGLKGTGLTFITIGLISMGFIGFSGMLAVQ